MRFYSTKNRKISVHLKTAVLQSLPPDNGLYMPMSIPEMPESFINNIQKYKFADIAIEIARPYLKEDFSEEIIRTLVDEAINFPAPLVSLNDQLHVLELWHGPSLAFKDFGARFMAGVMSQLVTRSEQKLTILVATSGDTGGAVAAGFLGIDNVEVIILYPSGGVSPLQEKQLTTLGQNITALEINGTFDDCQVLVKKTFLDKEVNEKYNLSSANSINIARLIPQTFYYFEAYRQLMVSGSVNSDMDIVFSIPSGNFGNLTAGLLAKRMGLPVSKFIAATNANDVVPQYLTKGRYQPQPSIATISNAMDVGDPSNFKRMQNLYGSIWEDMRQDIVGFAYNDKITRDAIKEISERYDYIMDPHGAVGYLAAKAYQKDQPKSEIIILETAHPAKFLPVMNPILGDIEVPERLTVLSERKKVAISLGTEYGGFKEWLMDRKR